MNIRIILSILVIIAASVASLSATAASHPCPVEADLWVLAGQSNMEGCAVTREQPEPNECIWMFNMDDTWMRAQHPVHRLYEAAAPIHMKLIEAFGYDAEKYKQARATGHPARGTGPGLFFAQHLVANGIKTVGLIPSAHGGSSMDQWDPALKDKGDDSLYGAMMNRITKIGGNIKGLIWYQGESDTDGGASQQYEQKMLNFIDAVRQDTGLSDLPMVYVQIGRYVASGLPASKGIEMQRIREAQRRIMSKRKNVYMVSAIDLSLDDVIHISFEGQQRLGKRIAEIALSQVYQKSSHAHPIDLESIQVAHDASPAYIKVRFSGVDGKLSCSGRCADFELVTADSDELYLVTFRTDLDPTDPAAVILTLQQQIKETTQLIYGGGANPYCNIVDEKDIPLPAFGPVNVFDSANTP